MTVNEFRAIAIRCDPYITHHLGQKTDGAYTTWHEFHRIPLGGDNREAREAWRFQVDRFTRDEDDPMVSQIYGVLDADPRLTRPDHRVQYERETGYIHHIFQVQGV